MNKLSLIKKIAEKTGFSIVATTNLINEFESAVVESLKKGDDVRLPGFLIMTVKHVAATTGRNPKNGAPIKIAAREKISVKAGKALKDAVNKK